MAKERASEALGAALGMALAGYRDKDPNRAADGLAAVVAIVRSLEDRISYLEGARSIENWPFA